MRPKSALALTGLLLLTGCGSAAPNATAPPSAPAETAPDPPPVRRPEEDDAPDAPTGASPSVDDDEAPGWRAIEAALRTVYGDQQPAAHLAPTVPHALGGDDPIDGTTVYRSADGSHWHYTTFGMSELYEKVSSDPTESGWGFEFTFRLVCDAHETTPPTWPVNLLNNLARYVFNNARPFAVGHRIPLNSSIHADADSVVRAALFAEDAELGSIQTPFGSLTFLHLVGVSEAELALAQEVSSEAVLTALRSRTPHLAVDLHRSDFAAQQDFVDAVRGR